MQAHLLVKMDSGEEAVSRLTSPTMGWRPSLLTSEEAFCACVVRKVSSIVRMRNMWSLCLLPGLDSAPPIIFLLLSSSCGIGPQGTDFSCSPWGPSISCLSHLGCLINVQILGSHPKTLKSESLWLGLGSFNQHSLFNILLLTEI